MENYAISKEGADTVEEIVKNGETAVAIEGNLSNSADVKNRFASTKNTDASLRVLVNNAAVYQFAPMKVAKKNFTANLISMYIGLILATQEAFKLFGDNRRSIINRSSVVNKNPFPIGSLYSGTKSALNSITNKRIRNKKDLY